ncbi:hypothetical protein [Gracilibacillus sp. D59]|uniref:hypothetical protein n=1 Tax=Gracilibacillus sp. D59 TaxID=3457434 RepID=UPI003FCC6376
MRFLFLFFLIFLVGCDLTSKEMTEFYDQTPSVDLAEEAIKSVSINSDENKVIEVFGKPNFIETIQRPKSRYYIYGKDKTEYHVGFRLANGEVKRYSILSSEFTTSKGIGKGDSKQDVLQAYGKNYYEREETGANIIGYIDKVHKINIEFGMSGDQVNGIIVLENN